MCLSHTLGNKEANSNHDCPWPWGHFKRPPQERAAQYPEQKHKRQGPERWDDLESGRPQLKSWPTIFYPQDLRQVT